jgi:hypothetical protein
VGEDKMTAEQFKQASHIAFDSKVNLFKEYLSVFDGFGLPEFKPIWCTVKQVARLIRWQCQFMNGTWDTVELNSIANFGRKKFKIIN